MEILKVIPKNSLVFAPMEGITDEPYRLAMHKAFPEWDYTFTDFLRLPSQGQYTEDKILSHFGKSAFEKSHLKTKTGYQILTTTKAQTQSHVEKIERLGFEHIDLNIGCPSKKVNSHFGGAYLLSDLKSLEAVLKSIRNSFNGLFTVKIRAGYRDDRLFEDIIRIIEDQGVEGITIHGRTRDQLYDGIARWDYIEKAVKLTSVPIIGNGDIWTLQDIDKMFNQTGCHAVMVARGALKTPWLATLYKEYKNSIHHLSDEFLLEERKKYIDNYFYFLLEEYKKTRPEESSLLRRFKAFSRYIFDDFDNAEKLRSNILRSQTLSEFWKHIEAI